MVIMAKNLILLKYLTKILRIVLLKMSTFSLTFVFENALSQLNSLIASLVNLVFASL